MVIFAVIMCMLVLTGCGNEQVDLGHVQVVRIVCDKQSGSGVIYEAADGKLTIVTAAHVVEGVETVKVMWRPAAEEICMTSKIIEVSGLDLAFLQIENADAQWTVMQNACIMEKKEAEKVTLRGRDSSGGLLESTGVISEDWLYVEDFGCHMMIGNAEVSPGMSGGGVFDESGVFRGIICGMDEDNHVAILPAAVIASEYDVIVWE